MRILNSLNAVRALLFRSKGLLNIRVLDIKLESYTRFRKLLKECLKRFVHVQDERLYSLEVQQKLETKLPGN